MSDKVLRTTNDDALTAGLRESPSTSVASKRLLAIDACDALFSIFNTSMQAPVQNRNQVTARSNGRAYALLVKRLILRSTIRGNPRCPNDAHKARAGFVATLATHDPSWNCCALAPSGRTAAAIPLPVVQDCQPD